MHPVRILWAEDTLGHFIDCSRTLKTSLEERGFAAEIVNSVDGGEVFKYLLAERFDVVILDITMERFGGLEVLPEINRLWPGMPIVVVSEHVTDENVRPQLEKAVEAGQLRSFHATEPRQGFCRGVLNALTYRANTILHLSDLHFGSGHAFRDVTAEELMSYAVAEVHKTDKIDLLVVSGDFASVGSESEFGRSREFIGQLCRDLRLPLSRLVVVPGNHDIDRKADSESAHFSNYIEFLISLYGELPDPTVSYATYPELYDTERRMLYGNARRRGGQALYSVAIYDDLRLIVVGLNSVVAKANEYDYGRVNVHQLLEIRKRLVELQHPQREYFKIAVFHHNLFVVPSFRSDGEPQRVVRNPALVLHHLIDCGVRLILHGHTHYSIAHEYRPIFLDSSAAEQVNPTYVIATGTFGAADREPSQPYAHATIVRTKLTDSGCVRGLLVTPLRLVDERLKWDRGEPVNLSVREVFGPPPSA